MAYTLKVVNIRKETEDTITLCFKQPALRKIRYKAGQYLTLIFRINGRRYLRPYSFSSAPVIDPLIEVTVKRVLNGIVSNHIHDQVKIGDAIEVMEPMGDFIYNPADENVDAIYLWGVGSGITPLISLTKEILNLDIKINVNLIYGNKNFDTTIFSEAIDTLLKEHPKRFKVWHFHTQLAIRESSPFVIEGRISRDYSLHLLKGVNILKTKHYICGPAGLKESVKEVLSILNLPQEHILVEDFELIKDPKDFEVINTEDIKLKFQGTEYALEVIKGKSILEAALDAGLELPYSCQTGSCSTCKALCLSGEIKMIGLSKQRNDLKSDEYLLCCSYPLTNNVHIEI